MDQTITWKIGGEAGFGIMTTGSMFSRLVTRHGYEMFDYVEYPSLVRGGHNVYEVCAGVEVFSQERKVDILVALNQETIDLHIKEMKPGGIILYDEESAQPDKSLLNSADIEFYPMPLAELTRRAGASKLMENNVTLGATVAILSMELSLLDELIKESFGKKGDEIVSENQKVAKLGFDYINNNTPKFNKSLAKRDSDKKMVVSGNEAVVLGALAGGCKFYAAYPMTPASSALHYMAKLAVKHDLVVKHVEDEISAINMTIGAAYAGVRSMTGSSGGGFSLMVEGLGLSAITETPIVILMVSRAGPASGMPTWYGQGDLKFLIHASQDEFPRIVIAPGDTTEAFYLSAEAFNLAEKFQIPVFILSDKYLAEGHQSSKMFDQSQVKIDRGKLISWDKGETYENYLRYKITDDGVSERALPGMKKAVFTANSYEHNEYGFSTEDIQERTDQIDKRNRKLGSYIKSIPKQSVYGDENSEITLVAWGSTKSPVLEAMRRLKLESFSHKVNFIHFTHLWPFPSVQAQKALSRAKKIMLIEGNSQGQLGSLIKENAGINIENKYLKYDGRPFYPDDVIVKIKEQFS